MNVEVGPSDVEALVARLRAAGCVFAEDEARLLVAEAGSVAGLEEMTRRRAAGVPLEQVLGWVAFGGIRLVVEPGVFVPRRRTELLAEHAVRVVRSRVGAGGSPVVVELCCGAAPVAAVVAYATDRVQLHAADLDPVAVACARRNLGARAQVWSGDLYRALPGSLAGRVDLLVANAPYVPVGALALLPPEAREHEPTHALAGGPDGLAVLRPVIEGAAGWLAEGGELAVETGAGQAAAVVALADRAGLTAEVVHDPVREATLVSARRPTR